MNDIRTIAIDAGPAYRQRWLRLCRETVTELVRNGGLDTDQGRHAALLVWRTGVAIAEVDAELLEGHDQLEQYLDTER